MSVHEQQNARLYDYLEGVLNAEERDEFVRHLEDCEECRSDVRKAERLDQVVATIRDPELPAGFMDRLRARLDEVDASPQVAGMARDAGPTAVQGRRPPQRSWFRPLLAAAAVTLAVGLGVSRLHPSPDPGGGQATVSNAVVTLAAGPARIGSTEATTVRVLPVDTVVETGPQQRSVLLVGLGNEVRLDHSSQVKVHANGELELLRGNVYVTETGTQVRIATPLGRVEPAGSAFDVSLTGPDATVRVWDGQVKVQPQTGAPVTVGANLQVTLSPSGAGQPMATSPDAWVEWNRGLPAQAKVPAIDVPLGSP